jgi:PHD/YefM family antitoxin component YafN of YafNO toxin-antitoxin module
MTIRATTLPASVDPADAAIADKVLSLRATIPGVIALQVDYDRGTSALASIRAYRAAVREWFRPMKEAAAQVVTAIRGREQAVTAPLDEWETTLETGLRGFVRAERVRRDEADAAARRLADDLARAADAQMADAAEALDIASVLELPPLVPIMAPPLPTSLAFGTGAVSAADDIVVTIDDAHGLAAHLLSLGEVAFAERILEIHEGRLKKYVKRVREADPTATVPGVTIETDVSFRRR